MDNITEISHDSLNKYFKVLKNFGYLNKVETDRVLIVSFIEEMLNDKFSDFITADDYDIIVNTVNKICSNSCIIKFPSFNVYTELIQDVKTYNKPRSTEHGYTRITNNDYVRVIA